MRGVKEVAIIDQALLGSADARKLDEYRRLAAGGLSAAGHASAARTRRPPIHGPVGLFEAVIAAGRKGITLQRYKGLGEMNPEPALGNHARHQCALAAAGEGQGDRRGQHIFAKLMGDKVEPRRIFIQENALAASVDA